MALEGLLTRLMPASGTRLSLLTSNRGAFHPWLVASPSSTALYFVPTGDEGLVASHRHRRLPRVQVQQSSCAWRVEGFLSAQFYAHVHWVRTHSHGAPVSSPGDNSCPLLVRPCHVKPCVTPHVRGTPHPATGALCRRLQATCSSALVGQCGQGSVVCPALCSPWFLAMPSHGALTLVLLDLSSMWVSLRLAQVFSLVCT